MTDVTHTFNTYRTPTKICGIEEMFKTNQKNTVHPVHSMNNLHNEKTVIEYPVAPTKSEKTAYQRNERLPHNPNSSQSNERLPQNPKSRSPDTLPGVQTLNSGVLLPKNYKGAVSHRIQGA
jgi:hypothetical protein